MRCLNSILLEGYLSSAPVLFDIDPLVVPCLSSTSGSSSAPSRPACAFTLTSDDLVVPVLILTRDASRLSTSLTKGTYIRSVGRLGPTPALPTDAFAASQNLCILAEVVEERLRRVGTPAAETACV